jgi:hypothetical protein
MIYEKGQLLPPVKFFSRFIIEGSNYMITIFPNDLNLIIFSPGGEHKSSTVDNSLKY